MNILKRIKRKFLYIINHTLNNKVIIYWDGGICSQINMFCIGKFFEEKGYKVFHDTTWFTTCGTDLNGKKNRDFVFSELFPEIKLNIASSKQVSFYKEHFISNEPNYKILKPPVYLPLYYEAFPYFVKYRNLFIQNLKPATFNTLQNKKLLKDIKSHSNTCAVHIRRGDLSKAIESYGSPPEINYFIQSINTLNSENENTFFYLFSDEPQWVKENIVPRLSNINFIQVYQNSENKGYNDLFLMSMCKHIIASQGSFGIFAYILSEMKGTLICPNSLPNLKKTMLKENIPNFLII